MTTLRVLRSVRVADDAIVLILGNTINAIEEGRRALFNFLDADLLGARVVNRVEVVFEEVVSNIVRHGFEDGAEQTIRITANTGPRLVCLRFEDDGIAFDPLTVVPKTLGPALADVVLGGLGLPLVRKLSTTVTYRPGTPADAADAPAGFCPVNILSVAVALE